MILLNNYKFLKASSLLESVIAIAILSICILIAFSIYVNVVSKNKSINFYNAKHKVEDLTRSVLAQKDYEDDVISYDGFIIKKDVNIDRGKNIVELNFVITTVHRSYSIQKILPYSTCNEK